MTSPEIYEALKTLYYQDLLEVDFRLRNLIEGRSSEWFDFNYYMVHTLCDRVDDALNLLASELRLKGGNPETQPVEQACTLKIIDKAPNQRLQRTADAARIWTPPVKPRTWGRAGGKLI